MPPPAAPDRASAWLLDSLRVRRALPDDWAGATLMKSEMERPARADSPAVASGSLGG